jgi:ribosomal protein S9
VPPSPEKPWLSREDMARVVGADMKTKHYIMLVDVLDRLLKDPARGYIMDELSRYMRPSALAPPVAKVHVADAKGRMYATGKRKTSVARVWVGPGSGRVLINHAYLVEYFPRLTDRQAVLAPFVATETAGQFDVYATVKGGGTTGQSQALRHGIATALQRLRPDLRAPLRAKQKFGNKRYCMC